MEDKKIPVARAGKVLGQFTVGEIRQALSAMRLVATDLWFDAESRQWLRFADRFPQASRPPLPQSAKPPALPSSDDAGDGDEWRDPWLRSKDWKTPPAPADGDDKPATSAQKKVLADYGLQVPADLKRLQASAWIDSLPAYPVQESESHKSYGSADWRSCPPREKPQPDTKPASEKQRQVISSFEIEPPADLTAREASRWIDTLFQSDGAQSHRSSIEHKLVRAQDFLKAVRAHRTKGNSQRLTSEIIWAVVKSLYDDDKSLFAEREVKSEMGGTYPDFTNSSALANALMARLARDYPGCVDGDAPAPRQRPAATPAPAIVPSRPAPKGKGCAALILPPLFALAWMLAT
jgi:hypothetical protein